MTHSGGPAPSGYDRDAKFYDDVNVDREAELAFYRAILEGRRSLLDLGCGTGQLTRVLAEGRDRTVGVDSSGGMLEHARAGSVEYSKAEMERFALGERFDACICTFNTFQHLLTWQDALSFLGAVREHLNPGGILVFDVFNPNFSFLQERRGPVLKMRFFSRALGTSVVLAEETAYDRASQVNRIDYVYRADAREVGGEELVRHRFLMRQFFPQELDSLLHHGGFRIAEKLGDFDHSEFASHSPRQIPVCQPH